MTNEAQIQKYDETITSVAHKLATYAENLEDTELAVKLTELAKQANPTIKGIETQGPQRVRFRQLLLRQNSSNSQKVPEATKPGQLYTSTSDHIGDELEFIPVFTHNIRKKWGEEKIECQSYDGITGSRHGDCRTCPYGKYEPGARPECSSGTSYYIVDVNLTAIYQIDFIKTSAKAGRLIRQLSLPPTMWSRSFILSAKKISGNNRNYYELAVAATNNRTPEEVAKVCDMLFDYFESNYKKTLLLQAEYLKNPSGARAALPADAETEAESEEINFKDSI